MRLDLTGNGRIGDNVAPDALEITAEEVRRPFVELIDRLGIQQGANLDWWVTPLASRNTYTCALYVRLCRLVLARRLLQTGVVNEVVTDSPALAAIIAGIAGHRVRVSVAGGVWRKRCSQALGIIRRYGAACFHAGCQLVFARLILRGRAPLPTGPVVLIDTFFYGDSFTDGRLREHHYPGLLDSLADDERARVFFVPSYYGIRNYAGLFRKLRAQTNLILKEDVLRLSDYVYALWHPFRLRWPRGGFDFLGIDVGPLVRESLTESFAASGSIEGLLSYRCARRLQQRGLRPARIIEWFENQEIDHGANAGWRAFFPETPVIGFQGFLASRHYLCMFPTTHEADLRLLPNRVAVMGAGLAEPVREFCPRLEVEVAPALRFASVWRERSHEPDAAFFTILISLPLLPTERDAIVELAVGGLQRHARGRPWRCWVKPHPSTRSRDIERLAAVLPQGFTLVAGEFNLLLDQADALVGAASSTCVHALARGVPVAIAARPGALVQNPIPGFIDSTVLAVCYTSNDLSLTIERYANADASTTARRRELGRKLRAQLFEPVTRESVRRLLGFVQ